MGLLDKLEQVEIKVDSRLPEDDLMFCETQQQAYDESCRALREIRQQWKKAIQAQRDLLGIGQDGSLPYFGSNYRFGITDLNRELEKFHSRFISELTQHFNEKYSVTISTDAIKEHLIPAEPDPYRCDMDTSKEYHRNLRALSLHYEAAPRIDRQTVEQLVREILSNMHPEPVPAVGEDMPGCDPAITASEDIPFDAAAMLGEDGFHSLMDSLAAIQKP